MQPSLFWPTLTVIVGLSGWVVATRGRQGDLLAPYSVFILLMVAIFGIRPMFMVQDNAYGFYGLNTSAGFEEAALAGFLATLGGTLGYFLTGGSRVAEAEATPLGNPGYFYSLRRAAVIGAAFIVVSLAITASRGGGISLASLFEGRNDNTRAAVGGLPVFVTALPAAGAVLVSVVRVLVERTRPLIASERVAFWIIIVLAVVPPLALGNRRFLLPCLLAAVIATTAPRYERVARARVVVGASLGFLFLAILPFVRSTGSRGGDGSLIGATTYYLQQEGLLGAVRPFFVSYDTEMFNYVAYLAPRLGDTLPYGYGRGTVGDALLAPFPAALAPFDLWSNELLTRIFGGGCTTGYCPVPSVVGVLMYDIGLPGVLVGCFLIGMLARRYRPLLARHGGWRLTFVLGLGAFMPVLVRGNTVNLGYIAVTTLVMAALALRFCRVRRTGGNRGAADIRSVRAGDPARG